MNPQKTSQTDSNIIVVMVIANVCIFSMFSRLCLNALPNRIKLHKIQLPAIYIQAEVSVT